MFVESNLTKVFATPQDLSTCSALASMSDAVATAEVLVREFATQVAALGHERPLGSSRAYRWRLGTGSSMDGMDRQHPGGSAIDDRESPHLSNHDFHRELATFVPKEMRSAWASYDLVRARASRLVGAHASWEARARRGERLRSVKSPHHDKLLCDLINPYTVALEVCALGLAIEDVFDGVAFLLVPPARR